MGGIFNCGACGKRQKGGKRFVVTEDNAGSVRQQMVAAGKGALAALVATGMVLCTATRSCRVLGVGYVDAPPCFGETDQAAIKSSLVGRRVTKLLSSAALTGGSARTHVTQASQTCVTAFFSRRPRSRLTSSAPAASRACALRRPLVRPTSMGCAMRRQRRRWRWTFECTVGWKLLIGIIKYKIKLKRHTCSHFTNVLIRPSPPPTVTHSSELD